MSKDEQQSVQQDAAENPKVNAKKAAPVRRSTVNTSRARKTEAAHAGTRVDDPLREHRTEHSKATRTDGARRGKSREKAATGARQTAYRARETVEQVKEAPPVGIVASWVAFAATVICNVSFELLRLGGTTSAEVSGQVFAWFTPAGYAFSIWTLIYLALGVWLISITRNFLKDGPRTYAQEGLFCASCALNIAWLATFHFEHVASALVVIILLWGVLAALYAAEHRARAPLARRAPVSLYLGWISVASIANAANLSARTLGDVTMLGEVSTVALAVIALLAGYAMCRIADDKVFPLVIIWATVAVGVHLIDASPATATAVFSVTVVGALLTYLRPETLIHKKEAAA